MTVPDRAPNASRPQPRFLTSESVTGGHPDKLADRISDEILDHILAQDPHARVACETLVTTDFALVAGEITTDADDSDYEKIVRETILDVGYTCRAYGIDGRSCEVELRIDPQSRDIDAAVNESGAGDQGLMFGYATDETDELMPAPVLLAHRLARRLARVRESGLLEWLRPDGKTQVTMEYDDRGKPVRVVAVVVSAQHHEDGVDDRIRKKAIEEEVIEPVLSASDFEWRECEKYINPSGRFVTGGPRGDVGLTGRKIIVDTYGGAARHGGGAFSGKDATKVDRSGAYAARWAARNVVDAGIARRCEIQLAYVIGGTRPVSVAVDTFGTAKDGMPDESVRKAVEEVFDFRPRAIIEQLGLRRPVFAPTAVYGHFGRCPDTRWKDGSEIELFRWETDRTEELKAALELQLR